MPVFPPNITLEAAVSELFSVELQLTKPRKNLLSHSVVLCFSESVNNKKLLNTTADSEIMGFAE